MSNGENQVYEQQPVQVQSCAQAEPQVMQQQMMQQPQPVMKPETEQTQLLKKNFGVLGPASLLYALFYAFCMYKNGSGITYPFFLGGSLWFYCFCMQKLGISLKKDSAFYMISIFLLGLSTFLTADGKIIAMNKTGVWVLTISFLLHQFYHDANWTFGRYTGYVITAVFGSLGELARPFQDMAGYRKSQGKKGKGIMLYVIIGLCFSIPLFFIVWLLLMSADMVFLNMTENLFDALDIGNVFGVLFTVVLMFFMTYCIMAYLCKRTFSEQYKERVRFDAVIGITVMLPITLLYLVFSGVQIFCLFLGNINLENYTYAEYAREGFFQLLAVCIINLILVLIGHAYFKENRVLKVVMTVMSLCTYVMIASSAYRMILYIRHYYLTFLRVFVLWSLVVLFILLTGVIISIFKQKFPLFRYSMVVVTVCYLMLSFAHPDYWIAKCNVANMGSERSTFFDTDAYEDYRYLTHLSPDAAPAFAQLFAEQGFAFDKKMQNVSHGDFFGGSRADEESWGYYYLSDVYTDYLKMDPRSFNLSKFIAYQILK